MSQKRKRDLAKRVETLENNLASMWDDLCMLNAWVAQLDLSLKSKKKASYAAFKANETRKRLQAERIQSQAADLFRPPADA